MNDRKINYVCTVCSETFTRKSGARRHNDGIHAGTALFVRFIDYIIGRIEGLYKPSDPRLYRKKKTLERNVKNMASLENRKNATSGDKIPASQFTTFADETIKNQYFTIENVKSDFNRETNRTIRGKSNEPRLYDMQSSDIVLNGVERKKLLELREFFVLVQRNYREEIARDITDFVKYVYNIGRGHVAEIDKWLPFLRNLDILRQNFG